jgi:hypothetical protein
MEGKAHMDPCFTLMSGCLIERQFCRPYSSLLTQINSSTATDRSQESLDTKYV